MELSVRLSAASVATMLGNNWADKAAGYGADSTRRPKSVMDVQGYVAAVRIQDPVAPLSFGIVFGCKWCSEASQVCFLF